MEYSLAKELKKAGFGFTRCTYVNVYDESSVGECAYCEQAGIILDGDHYKIPTLSELIDACGDRFVSLKADRVSNPGETWWSARGTKSDNGYNQSTPEEAVANLWLELSK